MAKKLLTEQELEELVEKVLATLTPREEQILKMRFGININKEADMGVREVARRFETTHKRVREIEAKALRCLKRKSS